jgi:hypothetical protein
MVPTSDVQRRLYLVGDMLVFEAGSDLSRVSQIDLVADGPRLGAAHRLASPNDAV